MSRQFFGKTWQALLLDCHTYTCEHYALKSFDHARKPCSQNSGRNGWGNGYIHERSSRKPYYAGLRPF